MNTVGFSTSTDLFLFQDEALLLFSVRIIRLRLEGSPVNYNPVWCLMAEYMERTEQS